MADSNNKQVFEEEGQRDDQDKDEETKSTSMRGTPTKNSPSRAAGPRRAGDDDDDDSSVGSSSSGSSASSKSSKLYQSSSRCPSPIRLPTGCLRGIHDKPGGCDEAELRAREKRCMEIMRLSQQVKKAERARAKAASIKPLTWAEPTFEFECGPTAAAVNAATNNLLGKRKEHPDQDQDSSPPSTTRRNPSPPSHLDLMQGQVFYSPIRQPTLECFVKFVKENMP
jgi:hypothetical protein